MDRADSVGSRFTNLRLPMDVADGDTHTLEVSEDVAVATGHANVLLSPSFELFAARATHSSQRRSVPPRGRLRSGSWSGRPTPVRSSSKSAFPAFAPVHNGNHVVQPVPSFPRSGSASAATTIVVPLPEHAPLNMSVEDAAFLPKASVSMPVVRFEPLTASFANVAHRWSPTVTDDYQMLDQEESPGTRKRVWLEPEMERWLPADLCQSQDVMVNSGDWVLDDVPAEQARESLLVAPTTMVSSGYPKFGRRSSI